MDDGAQAWGRYFDLNIERVLEHWPVAFAIRELIANALDEHAITDTAEPVIVKDGDGAWHVTDFGRGLRYEHLTQKENDEKRRHPKVIGQFGIGLKDALAVFDRRKVRVEIRSRFGDITTEQRTKGDFADVRTLHAIIHPPARSDQVGTDVVLRGVSDADVATAKHFFLHYSGDRLLETTRHGGVLARSGSGPARVYVKGLLVAEEENFLFSYNITDINAPLRRALNRERSNVGRTAYADRVKATLLQCRSAEVARPLADDLAEYVTGRMHDELSWKDVTVHACTVLASHEKVVFVTPAELQAGSPQLRYAEDEGYQLVTVPDDISTRLRSATDIEGQPIFNLDGYREAWNDSFTFRFVEPGDLTTGELATYKLTEPLVALARLSHHHTRVGTVLISETMRLDDSGDSVAGLWEPEHNRIVIRRDQLADPRAYCGTLLHELTHAASGYPDNSLDFENALTTTLGHIAVEALRARPADGTRHDTIAPPSTESTNRWRSAFRHR